MDCSPSCSSVRGVEKKKIPGWVAISFSRISSWIRDGTCVSYIAGRFFTTNPLGKSNMHFRSDQISRSVVSVSSRPHESQHARPPCPSPTPGVHSDSRPSSQ